MKFEDVIGVTMEPSESIIHKNLSYEQMAVTIAEQMIKSRGTADVKWKPFIKQDAVEYCDYCSDIYVHADKFYPDAKPGDAAYAVCDIQIEKDYEVWINLVGAVEAFLDGECIFSSWDRAMESEDNLISADPGKYYTYINIPVKLSADKRHRLIIKTVCTEKSFGFRLNISPPRCPSLWAKHYLIMARVMLPNGCLSEEEGIAVSKLYSSGKTAKEAYESTKRENDLEFAFPIAEKEDNCFDFKKLYGDGCVAYAYSMAEKDTKLTLSANSPMKVFINKKEIETLNSGAEQSFLLKKGDEILIKSLSVAGGWGFCASDAENMGIAWLDTKRRKDFTFTVCGPFFQGGLNTKLPPECVNDLFKPFENGRGKMVFWRFKNAYLRAYHMSGFFGQWYYATMLTLLGIEHCGRYIQKNKYQEYFLNAMSFLADWYDYAKYDTKEFGIASFMCLAEDDKYLDNIGTMGVNFIEAYRITGDVKYLRIIEVLRHNLKQNVSRFSDGTFCRKAHGTMWADDFYMSGPFLSELYETMNDQSCLEDMVCQLRGFKERLYIPEEKLYSHIYFLDKSVKNSIPWGRGNGWIALSMSEMLMRIPKAELAFEEIRAQFEEFCEGIAARQDKTGLWHQVLNAPDSYLESSCTAMFTLAMLRGVRYGWLPKAYKKYADKGLLALQKYCIDKNGVLYGVCMGSSCSMNPEYYFNLTTIKDDNHGTGIVLMLLCEIIQSEQAEQKKKGENI